MAKDTLKKLDREVDRLLFVGAQIAQTDPTLASAKEKLAPLASRAPALGKVVDQIDNLQKAKGKAAASELLALSSLMAQVRGAQATPFMGETSSDLQPLPPAPKIGTPLTPTELHTLVGALTNAPGARERPRTIRYCAESGAARDLRILPLLVPALADGSIADVLTQFLLPAIGPAIAPELRKNIDIQRGRPLDVRLLRAISRIEKQDAKPLLHHAIEKGNADLRAAAIDELANIDKAEAEPIAVALSKKDKSKEVRIAAIAALAAAESDGALEALLTAFGGAREIRSAAETSLATSKHPAATSRIQSLYTSDLREIGHFKVKRATTKPEKDAAAKAQRAHTDKVLYVIDLIDLIAARGTDEGIAIILDIFRQHKVKEIRDAAARALLRVGYPGAWDELSPSLYEASKETQVDFIRGVLALEPRDVYARIEHFFDEASLKHKNGVTLACDVLVHFSAADVIDIEDDQRALQGKHRVHRLFQGDPRFLDLVLRCVDIEPLRVQALHILTLAKTPRSLEAALSASRVEGLGSDIALADFPLLAQHRDPRVLPAMIRLLAPLRGAWEVNTACRILTEYDDPALFPLLKAFYEAKQKKKKMPLAEKNPIEECLRFLGRDRSAPETSA